MSSVHQSLLNMNRKDLDLYMSTLLINRAFGKKVFEGTGGIMNEGIPFFEEQFGQLDYDWFLRLSKDRKFYTLDKPTVIRHIGKNNLSLYPEYRRRDFYYAMSFIDGNIQAMQRHHGSRARYLYLMGNGKMARYHFRKSQFNLKTILYYITSYFPSLRNMIIKKFRVFG